MKSPPPSIAPPIAAGPDVSPDGMPAALPKEMVLRLPLNDAGRDFIIGDVHGAYDAVIAAMRAVKFDRSRDRLICVGDLIDRGMGSARVVGFLAQPYVHAVRGNHDHDFCELTPEAVRVLATLPRLGMSWARNLSDEALFEIQSALRRLPLAIEFPTRRGLVGVVHAEPSPGMSWQAFTRALEARDPAAIRCALKSRERLRSGDCSVVDGVGRVFVGHTIQEQGARMFGNVVAVDTGAVLRELGIDDGHHLTMVNAAFKTADLGATVAAALRHAVIEGEGEGAFSSMRAVS